MTEGYEIILTSYPDCDDFVVEIWFHNKLTAIVKENGEIQLFDKEAEPSILNSNEFISVLNRAKKRLDAE